MMRTREGNIERKGLGGKKSGPRLRDWRSKMAIRYELLRVADILGVGEDDWLTRMFDNFIANQIAESEMRIGKLYLRDQSLRQKYKMGLEELQ
jgi:hypothetical protein